MATVPSTIVGKIEFFEEHLPVWAANAAAIGVDLAQIADLTARTASARASYESANATRTVARSATVTQRDDVNFMYDLGADLIKVIRAFAEATDDPSVYPTALIPPPSPGAPLGPPQTPKDLAGSLNSAGQIELDWDGTREGGTSFRIERSINSSGGPWTLIGTSEERSFIDTQVPTALENISYRVTAVRAGGASIPTNPFTILFGSNGSTGETLTLVA
jgi:hypothetical protein